MNHFPILCVGLMANLILALQVHAQVLDFALNLGGSSGDLGTSIAVDGLGSSYVTGIFSGTADFDPGPGLSNLTSAGNDDVFVAKYDASGNLVWAFNLGGTTQDFAGDISVNSLGYSHVVGLFRGTVDFDPGPSTFYLTSDIGHDIFVAKYDAVGNFVWAFKVGNSLQEENAAGIALDNADNIYVTGYFRGTIDFDPGPGIFNLTDEGVKDAFVAKYDMTGALIWAFNIGSSDGFDKGEGVAIDNANDIIVTGTLDGTADFDPGPGMFTLTATGGPGVEDIYVAKYSAAGNLLWAFNVGGSLGDGGLGLSVDGANNIYTAGYFETNVDFDPGPGTYTLTNSGDRDIFVAKYDAVGQFVWALGAGNTGKDQANDVVVDGAGHSLVVGEFVGTVDFDPGSDVVPVTSAGNRDLFVARYDAAGNLVWAFGAGSSGADWGTSIAQDGAGDSYVTGAFTGTVDFAPGASTFNLTSFTGSLDVFAVKLSDQAPNFPPTIGSITAPDAPVPVNTTISVGADFTDANNSDTHTAEWNWGDGITSVGTITESNGFGSVTDTHTYTEPGVYTITLTVTDNSDLSDESVFQFVVVYNPDGGFITGGGWLDSPAGAYTPDPALSGKASFGFVSRYNKGATKPSGQTQFNFHVAGFDFHSTAYEWLVIAGAKAKYKGTGTIGGSGTYGFMLTATDGQMNGGGGVDRFRIKIWDKQNGDVVVYDNQPGDVDDAEATDAIEGGSIVIHQSGKKAGKAEGNDRDATPLSAAEEAEVPERYALGQNYPNPFNPVTTISFDLPQSSSIKLKVYDMLGREVAVLASGDFPAGRFEVVLDAMGFPSGVYVYRLEAGNFTETKKLIVQK